MRKTNKKSPSFLRIHGDNILECERTLSLIAGAFRATAHRLEGPIYRPRFEIRFQETQLFTVELLPGHGRWGLDVQDIIQSAGAPLRESTDAIVTHVLIEQNVEEVLFAIEFCNALPAGNNAWQRNGRALACATVGIPYLYLAEVGGLELDEKRKVKAPRFPNPIIPFSYLTAGRHFNVLCMPVYSSSPSSSEEIRNRFKDVFGMNDGQEVVKCLLERSETTVQVEGLLRKALLITQILAEQRRRLDTLRGGQWKDFLELDSPERQETWLKEAGLIWSRKRADKVKITKTLNRLITVFREVGGLSVGAGGIPICLIPHESRGKLAEKLKALYGEAVTGEFLNRILSQTQPLIGVWITGFKPRGDDSRPDRGLVPLARMIFGNGVDILSIVYGPAKPNIWLALRNSPEQLARQNGLWESIINLSDVVLADSMTDAGGPFAVVVNRHKSVTGGPITFPMAQGCNQFSEHDVDSALHALFSQKEEDGVFEAMCNPPGGDWSGLSILDFQSRAEMRWTSLPRVSGVGGKRPDHVLQFTVNGGKQILLAIESKNRPTDLERGIGKRLKKYTEKLIKMPPLIFRSGLSDWGLWQSRSAPRIDIRVISGGAFCWAKKEDLEKQLKEGELDIVFALQFDSREQLTLLHVMARPSAQDIIVKILSLSENFGRWLKVQVH